MTRKVLTRCTSQQPYEKRCNGWMDTNGKMHAGCGDACSFMCMKPGAGDPPFLREDVFMEELRLLTLRKNTNTAGAGSAG